MSGPNDEAPAWLIDWLASDEFAERCAKVAEAQARGVEHSPEGLAALLGLPTDFLYICLAHEAGGEAA